MKCVYILSLLALAAARPQYYYAAPPTPGPIYYKPINPNFYYSGYLPGQFRAARSEEAAAPAEEAPAVEENPVEEIDREGRADVAEARADEAPAPAPAPAPVYTTAAPPPPPAYPAPPPAYHPVPEPAYAPAAYNFEWLVKDDYSKNDYGHKESRNGKNAQGSYHVALPDGRIQTVTYGVDGYGGYIAEVSYSGEAQYPDTPAYKPAAAYKPAYKPAPAPYKPAPAPVAYKPAPAPAPYKPAPAPAYPVQPAASVRKYSFRHLPAAKEVEVVAEEARTGEGVEVVIDEQPILAAAPIQEESVVEETARSGEGVAIVIDEPAPIEEEAVVEETARSGDGVAIFIDEAAPIEEAPIAIVAQAESRIDEDVEAPREQKSLSDAAEEIAEDAPAIVEEPVAPVAPTSYRYYYRY